MSHKTIGEFAKLFDVGVETIRYYQRQELLDCPPLVKEFGSKKIRRYNDKDFTRLGFILSAKKAGFTLKEIKELLELDAKNDREKVRSIAQNRIKKLDCQLAELNKARDSLFKLVQECQKTDSQRCPILAAFIDEQK